MRSIFGIVVKRLGLGVLTIIVISVLIFLGIEALPGDVATAILGQEATPETVAAFRKELKLDLPPHVRYFAWLGDFLRGDMGTSLANKRPISELIFWRFKNTIFLAASAAALAVPIAVILGILAALYRNSLFDRTISMVTLSTISFPEFFVAYILIALLSVQIVVFPSISNINEQMSFWQKIYSIILPCLTLTLVVVAHMMRQTRAAIINILASPFIEMARLKGIKRMRVIVMHAFPNALSPVINVIALNLAYLVVGVVIVEVVFVYPGMGQLLVDSVSKRDIPVVQASGLIFAAVYVGLNLLGRYPVDHHQSQAAKPKIRRRIKWRFSNYSDNHPGVLALVWQWYFSMCLPPCSHQYIAPYSETEIVGDVWAADELGPPAGDRPPGTGFVHPAAVRRAQHHCDRLCHHDAVFCGGHHFGLFCRHAGWLDGPDIKPLDRYPDGVSDPYLCLDGTVGGGHLRRRPNHNHRAA